MSSLCVRRIYRTNMLIANIELTNITKQFLAYRFFLPVFFINVHACYEYEYNEFMDVMNTISRKYLPYKKFSPPKYRLVVRKHFRPSHDMEAWML